MDLFRLAKIQDFSLKNAKMNSHRMTALAFRLVKEKPEEREEICRALDLAITFDKLWRKENAHGNRNSLFF